MTTTAPQLNRPLLSQPTTPKIHAYDNAERALLGRLLTLGYKGKANAAFEQSSDLCWDDFYERKHQIIWHGMKQIAERSEAITLDTVEAELQTTLKNSTTRAIDVVKVDYLKDLLAYPHGDILEMVKLIRKASIKRKASLSVKAMQAIIDDDKCTLPQMMDGLMSHTSAIALSVSALDGKPSITLHEDVSDLARRTAAARKAYENGEALAFGVLSGYREIDDVTYGFQRRELVVVTARPGIGKSAWAVNVALNAMRQGTRVLIIPLEMSHNAMTARLMAIESGISAAKIKMGALTDEECKKLAAAFKTVQGYTASKQFHYLSFEASPTMAQVGAKLHQHMSVYGADLIIFDQLSPEAVSGMPRDDEKTMMSKSVAMLRGWADKYNVPVVSMAQLNRAGEGRPTLKNLAASDAMGRTPDTVIAIHREEQSGYVWDTEFIFLKQREGATPIVHLDYIPTLTKFTNYGEGSL